MSKKAKKSQRINEQTGINFRQHSFLGGVAFRRQACYIYCHPDKPWDHKIVSVEEYNKMCMNMEIGEDNDWYASYRLTPLEKNIRKLRFLEEKEYDGLIEAGLWAEVLEQLGIHEWEHFDTAFAELEKRKKERNEDD